MDSSVIAMDHVVDLRNLKFIPKALFENLVGHGNREKTLGQLAELVDALLSGDPWNMSLEGLSFNACYQLGRDHRAHWSGTETGVS